MPEYERIWLVKVFGNNETTNYVGDYYFKTTGQEGINALLGHVATWAAERRVLNLEIKEIREIGSVENV